MTTNREAYEEAAGMNLEDSFFTFNRIDPDAEYVQKKSINKEGNYEVIKPDNKILKDIKVYRKNNWYL